MDKRDLAISYAVRKRAAAKKMAMGGMVENEDLHPEHAGSSKSAALVHKSQKPIMDYKSIVEAIAARRAPITDGHELSIDENDDTDREVFLTADMPQEDTGSVDDVEMDEDPATRRRDMLRGVMSRISRKG
jgi:hypothetical protein